jgi:hypothetical protein
MPVDHHHDFAMARDGRFPLSGQKRYHIIAVPKTAECQFTNNGWVTEKAVVLNEFPQLRIAVTEMINPD